MSNFNHLLTISVCKGKKCQTKATSCKEYLVFGANLNLLLLVLSAVTLLARRPRYANGVFHLLFLFILCFQFYLNAQRKYKQ